MRIFQGSHFYALAVLEVDHLHSAVGDYDSVGSAKGVRYVLAEVQARFDKQLRVRCLGARGVVFLQYDSGVGVGIFVHFAGMIRFVVFGYFLFFTFDVKA